MNSLGAALNRALINAASIGLALMALILCWQVFSRYVLNSSPAWSEQLALVLTIWFVFLGAVAGIFEGFHIRIEEGVNRLPENVGHRVRVFAECVVLVFSVLLAVQGQQLVVATWGHAVPTLPLNQGQVYMVIPLAGALMLFATVLRLRRLLAGGGVS